MNMFWGLIFKIIHMGCVYRVLPVDMYISNPTIEPHYTKVICGMLRLSSLHDSK